MAKTVLSESIMEEWDRLRESRHDVSLWDAFTSLLKERIPSYLLTLRADIDIIKYIAQGYNVSAIHRMTGIPSKAIRKVALTWGVEPLKETLDFNAILMYNRDTTADMLYSHMNDFLAKPLTHETYEMVIQNIEKYFDLERFLQEEEEHDK